MKQAIALAYARMQESPAGDVWRATAVMIDFITPIALAAACFIAMISLAIGHLG